MGYQISYHYIKKELQNQSRLAKYRICCATPYVCAIQFPIKYFRVLTAILPIKHSAHKNHVQTCKYTRFVAGLLICDKFVIQSYVASGSEWRWAFLSSQHPNRLCLLCNSLLTSLCCSFALAKNSLASTTEWAKGFTYFPKICWQEMAEQKRQSSKKCLTVGFSQHKFRRTSSPIIIFTLTTWLRFVYRNYPKRAEGTCISD